MMNFDVNSKFSERMQETSRLMNAEAVRLKGDKLYSEHVVLAMLAQPESDLCKVLLGTEPVPLKRNLEAIARVRGNRLNEEDDAIVVSEEVERAVNTAAVYEAEMAKSEKIDPEHVLLGILHEAWRGSPCTQVLTQHKITYDTAKRKLFEKSPAS